jgi:hypothetical protein
MRRGFWTASALGLWLLSGSLAHAQSNSAWAYAWLGESSEQFALEDPAQDAVVATSADSNAIVLGDQRDQRSSEPSHVETPVRFELGALFGYGFGFERFNPWALGFGLNAGVDFGAIYLGLRFDYHFTETLNEGDSPLSGHLWDLGVVTGYDAKLSSEFTLRPYLSLGVATFSLSSSSADGQLASGSQSYFDLAAGISGVFDLCQVGFIGLDLGLSHLFGPDDATGLRLMFTAGVRL